MHITWINLKYIMLSKSQTPTREFNTGERRLPQMTAKKDQDDSCAAGLSSTKSNQSRRMKRIDSREMPPRKCF